MDDDSYEVPVRGSDGQGRTATFILHDHETDDAVTLRLIDGARTFSATADDYFEALVQLRQATAHHDLILSCYGASRNVFPSGMSRQMSRGTMAYKLTLGQPARYDALRWELQRVAAYARAADATVHMPRIGAGLAGGDWTIISEIIRDELTNNDIAVTVYDLAS